MKGPVKEIPVVKPLSRKQKKKYAKVLAKKQKKLNVMFLFNGYEILF